jgi:acetyl-CoA carboxylase biotin carboxyl carrier protein
MTLTARDVEEITRLLEASSFDELELEIDGLKIHLRRENGDRPVAVSAPAVDPRPSPEAPVKPRLPLEPGVEPVRAPLLGTYYRAPKPGAPPFVEVGARVEPDTIVGIIEVMKLMNTVRAGVRGTVREICARDGALVEYGETLLVIDTREPR